MGRRHRNQSELPLEKQVPVRLTDEQALEKSHRLAVIGQSIRGYKRELLAKNRDTRDAIVKLEEERAVIEDSLIASEELRAQGELKFGEDRGKVDGAVVVAKVAAAAAAGVLPSEPHQYQKGPKGCLICESDRGDPIHAARITDAPAAGENGSGRPAGPLARKLKGRPKEEVRH